VLRFEIFGNALPTNESAGVASDDEPYDPVFRVVPAKENGYLDRSQRQIANRGRFDRGYRNGPPIDQAGEEP